MAENPSAVGEGISATGEAVGILNRIIGWVSHRLGRRIRIREIKRKNDSDIEDTVDLYERLFKEEHRVYPAELTAWLRAKHSDIKAPNALQHCLLIAKRRGKVVAILKAMYCPESHWAFIAYFGVDTSDPVARKIASKILIKFFHKFAFSRWRSCCGVIFEIESPVNCTKDERPEAKGRLRLFRDIARHQGHQACEIKIDYYQPLMADAPAYRGTGRKMALMVVLTNGGDSENCKMEKMPQDKVKDILAFLYFKVYGTTQAIAMKNRLGYGKHLKKIYGRAVASLVDFAELDA